MEHAVGSCGLAGRRIKGDLKKGAAWIGMSAKQVGQVSEYFH